VSFEDRALPLGSQGLTIGPKSGRGRAPARVLAVFLALAPIHALVGAGCHPGTSTSSISAREAARRHGEVNAADQRRLVVLDELAEGIVKGRVSGPQRSLVEAAAARLERAVKSASVELQVGQLTKGLDDAWAELRSARENLDLIWEGVRRGVV